MTTTDQPTTEAPRCADCKHLVSEHADMDKANEWHHCTHDDCPCAGLDHPSMYVSPPAATEPAPTEQAIPPPCAVCSEIQMHKRDCLLTGRYGFRTPVLDLQRVTYGRTAPAPTVDANLKTRAIEIVRESMLAAGTHVVTEVDAVLKIELVNHFAAALQAERDAAYGEAAKEVDRFIELVKGRNDDRNDGAFVVLTRVARNIRRFISQPASPEGEDNAK